MTDSTNVRLEQDEFVAILQLATWHRACHNELLQAFASGDYDRAMWLLQLMVSHPAAASDTGLVNAVCERVWPQIFGKSALGHVAAMQASVVAEVARLQAAAAAGPPEPANDTPPPRPRGLFVVKPPREDLPS